MIKLQSAESKAIYESDTDGLYSTNSGTHRWPMHFFYNVLDMFALNDWILHKEVTIKGEIPSEIFYSAIM